jgi:bifunctional ADP-heptose synthase (sugar kinase/adenylyltransferase)
MKKVLVIGDGCLDIFEYGKCDRLSPEAPVVIFKPTSFKQNEGMAINVHNNIEALGLESTPLTNPKKPTKKRLVDEVSNQMLIRVDTDDDIARISLNTFDKIKIKEFDGVIISDYNKGFLLKSDIAYIGRTCRSVEIPLFLDTKKNLASWGKHDINYFNFIKINEKEYWENENNFEDFENHLITTLGKDGAKHYDKTLGTITMYPIENKAEVRDLSGAGDTFLAGFVADYLENDDIASAIKFANRCASYVVTQKGVVVLDKDKI